MPPVPFCNLDELGSDWERQMNKKLLPNIPTFNNAQECTSRNDKFQNSIAKNQFQLPNSPLNSKDLLPAPGASLAPVAPVAPMAQQAQQAPMVPYYNNQYSGPDYQGHLGQMAYYNQAPERIPQNYPVYQQYEGPLPQRWNMYDSYGQQAYGYGQQVPERVMVENFGQPFDKTEEMNKLLTIITIILSLLFVVQLIDVLKN
jgi:hypothetical protein